MTARRRGFSLLEVLLAIALVGTGVMALLVVRSNSIDLAANTIRLRAQRLLLAQHAGHHLAYHLDPANTPALDDWQEDFPGFDVQHRVDEMVLDELLTDELRVIAEPGNPAGDGPPPPGSNPATPETATGPPIMLRALELTVTPPGSEADAERVLKIVTYKLVAPKAADHAPSGSAGAAGAGAGDDQEPSFPSYPETLVGPDAKAPGSQPGTTSADPNAPGGNQPSTPGGNDPNAPGGN